MTEKTANTEYFIKLEKLLRQRARIFIESWWARRYCRAILMQGHALQFFISDDYFLNQNQEIDITSNEIVGKIFRALDRMSVRSLMFLHLSDRFYRIVEFQLMKVVPFGHSLKVSVELKRVNDEITQLRSEFITKNMSLVRSVVYKYSTKRSVTEDLLQEGVVGLLYAFERYDLRAECQFSTYAVWYIRQRILIGLQHISEVRIPNYVLFQNNKVLDEVRGMITAGRDLNEIVEQVKNKKIKYLPMNRMASVSMDSYLSYKDEKFRVENLLGNESSVHTFDFIGGRKLHQKINDLLKKLTPREEKILRLRFGIVDVPGEIEVA